MMRKIFALSLAAGLACSAPAFADLNYTQGSGTVIFDFTCFTTKHCPAFVPETSAGTELFTSSTPGQVTGANGTFPATQSGTWTVQPGNTANTTPWLVKPNDGTNSATIKAGSTASVAGDTSMVVQINPNQPALTNAQPGNFTQIGGASVSTGVGAADTGTQRVTAASSAGCTGVIAVNQTASTDLKTSSAKLHICSIVLVSATAQSISLVEGTGTTCATGTAALIGGTSASVAVAANGGFSAGSGIPFMVTQTTADHLCLLQSGVGNVSGIITYADHS